MVKLFLKSLSLFILLILLSIQGSTNLDKQDQVCPNQRQLKNNESPQNLSLDPDFGKIPLYFIPNRGQVDEKALFYAKTSRYTLWLTKEGLVFDSTRRIKKESPETKRLNPRKESNPEDIKYDRDVSRSVFLNANRSSEVIPADVTEHKVNYFIGSDESKWRTNIETSRAVLYRELYPNIDLKVYGVEKQIEYDFVVKPGGEVSDIGFEYKDVEETRINKEGNLVIKTKFGELEHARPECYQVIGGERVEIKAEFKRKEDNTYGFKVKEYNKDYELIIDPLVLVYSTFLGGSDNDRAQDIVVDSTGSVYVRGMTNSMDFPIKNPIQGGYGGGDNDFFIAKINASGTALIYSTYLGGSGEGTCDGGIVVDSDGAVYVTGYTNSKNFPTKNPIQGSNAGGYDAFITKINSAGNKLIYSTYLGGSGEDQGSGIAVDSKGVAYVTGGTGSVDFPTKNAIQGGFGGGERDAFIINVNSSGSGIIYSTYLGGSGDDQGSGIAVDSKGAAYVAGGTGSVDFPTKYPIQGTNAGVLDIFITKINSSGSALIYSTYLGGSYGDYYYGIAVDSKGAAYVTGDTNSFDFPTKNPIQGTSAGGLNDAFITKINASGTAFIYSTYLGGYREDFGKGIAVDSKGAAYVAGFTDSSNFPIKNPIQSSFGGGFDVFITKVNASGGAFIYSTYLGGSGWEIGFGIGVDSEGATYVTGATDSDFPTKNAIQGSFGGAEDAFIAKILYSAAVPPYSLTIIAGSGGTTDPSPSTYTYDEETEVTITAIPNSGYTFSGWSGDVSGTTNPITITVDSDMSIKANFTKESGGGGGGGESPGGDGCFIATACYGTPMAGEVKILCAFRNQYLITNPTGKAMIKVYETLSPKVADFIKDKEDLKAIIRECLKPVIWIAENIVE